MKRTTDQLAAEDTAGLDKTAEMLTNIQGNKGMNRGFACLSLDNPKTPENVGSVIRAAYAYGVAQVSITGGRHGWLDHGSNTIKGHRHMPVLHTDDPCQYVPWGTAVVAVEIVDDAIPLPLFKHPERALYVFGAEDATLEAGVLCQADYCVFVPGRSCMNLAACVNVLLYDRMAKGSEFGIVYPAYKSNT